MELISSDKLQQSKQKVLLMSNLKPKKNIQKCPVCKSKSMECVGSVWFYVECMNCGFSFDGSSGVLYEQAIEHAKAKIKDAKKENHE